jgi:mannosyltransferase OCH1-like enzyme
MVIPRIIHQTWKNHDVPPEWRLLQQTWKDLHPAWEYRLWTDADNREFLRRHYAWFLPTYDAYPENIMRADAVRYFILHFHGGVYADLDLEALRPLDDLLADKELALGLAPAAQAAERGGRSRGFEQVVECAFMASVPAHPFWAHVFGVLAEWRGAASTPDATGPFLLTRAYRTFAGKDQLSALPAELIFPLTLDDFWKSGRSLEELRQSVPAAAYTLHHWSGSWWREAALKAVRERLGRRREGV